MYLDLQLTKQSVFHRTVKENYAILLRYTPWSGTERRFGTTYNSHFQ